MMVPLFPGEVAHACAFFKEGQAHGSVATAREEEVDMPVIPRFMLVVDTEVIAHFLVCYSTYLSGSHPPRLGRNRSDNDHTVVALVPDYCFGFQGMRWDTINDLVMGNAVQSSVRWTLLYICHSTFWTLHIAHFGFAI
jgi:hypothetical protein